MAEHKENEIKEEINQKHELLKKIREFKDKKALAAVLQEELETCMASLNLNFNNQMKFNLVVQSKLEEIKKTNHVVSCVSFGIGAAGDGTTGIQTRQAKKFLQTPKDLVNFREYSDNNNYYLGSSHHEGNVAGSRDAIITSIKENFSLAMALQRDSVLYYTGHGSGNINMQGDWCFSDSSLRFVLLHLALMIRRVRTVSFLQCFLHLNLN